MSEMPPTCPLGISRETLSAWRDGALPPAEMARIADHVDGCRACQRRLDQYARIAAALGMQQTPDLREQTWRGLQPRLTQQRITVMNVSRLRSIAIGATLLAVIAAFALLFTYFAPLRTHPGTGTSTGTTASVVPTMPATAAPTYPPTATYPPVTPTATPQATPTTTGTTTTCQLSPQGPLDTEIPFPPGTIAGVGNGAGGEVVTAICSPGGTPSSITAYLNAHLPSAGWHPYNPAVDKNGCQDTFWTWANAHSAIHLDFTMQYQGKDGPQYWTLWRCERINA